MSPPYRSKLYEAKTFACGLGFSRNYLLLRLAFACTQPAQRADDFLSHARLQSIAVLIASARYESFERRDDRRGSASARRRSRKADVNLDIRAGPPRKSTS